MKMNSQITNSGLADPDATVRAPRYTSYPPANHFNASVGAYQMERWLRAVPKRTALSLYIHVPFCRNLCWFCACRTQGVQRTAPLVAYVETLKRELSMVAAFLDPTVQVRHLHIGGGTPTILPAPLMADLLHHIRASFTMAGNFAFAVEIDPTEIDRQRFDVLAEDGLTRASIGIQDFNPIIQKAIGRPQSWEVTAEVVAMIRDARVDSINFDLLYGLPHQTEKSFATTLAQISTLVPDRVAMFGYAHVPWMARRQVMIDQRSLPAAGDRRRLLELGRHHFQAHGLQPVGIDHFARPSDNLVTAANKRQLRRNFQGYTDDRSDHLIGIGASAISRLPQGYAQNAAGTSAYQAQIRGGGLATARGHRLSDEDRLRGYVIEQLMCHFGVSTDELIRRFAAPGEALANEIETRAHAFGLAESSEAGWYQLAREPHVTARLACLAFDSYQASGIAHSLTV